MYNKLNKTDNSLEEIFKVAFEKNAAPTAIFNLDTTIAMVNDAYCECSGYTREEIIGMSWTKQLPPEELERLIEYNRKRLANPDSVPSKYEFAFYTKHGQLKYGYTSIATLLQHELLIMSFVDVTEEKQIAIKLAQRSIEKQELIEKRNKEIALSVSQLSANNKSNIWLLSKIKELKKISQAENHSLMPILKEMEVKISSMLEMDTWEKVLKRFQFSYPDSLSNLLIRHPALTPAEIKLCALLSLNLDTKEIAMLLNLTYNSIRIARTRLRKKLKIEADECLTAYLMKFK